MIGGMNENRVMDMSNSYPQFLSPQDNSRLEAFNKSAHDGIDTIVPQGDT